MMLSSVFIQTYVLRYKKNNVLKARSIDPAPRENEKKYPANKPLRQLQLSAYNNPCLMF